jgi:hypothetical protein
MIHLHCVLEKIFLHSNLFLQLIRFIVQSNTRGSKIMYFSNPARIREDVSLQSRVFHIHAFQKLCESNER